MSPQSYLPSSAPYMRPSARPDKFTTDQKVHSDAKRALQKLRILRYTVSQHDAGTVQYVERLEGEIERLTMFVAETHLCNESKLVIIAGTSVGKDALRGIGWLLRELVEACNEVEEVLDLKGASDLDLDESPQEDSESLAGGVDDAMSIIEDTVSSLGKLAPILIDTMDGAYGKLSNTAPDQKAPASTDSTSKEDDQAPKDPSRSEDRSEYPGVSSVSSTRYYSSGKSLTTSAGNGPHRLKYTHKPSALYKPSGTTIDPPRPPRTSTHWS